MALFWVGADQLRRIAREKLIPPKSLLDIGCGIQPQRYPRPEVHICCEPFDQYVEKLREKIVKEPDRNFVVIKATWEEAIKIFPPKSVDTVILHDVIEHLEKDQALRLLQATEPIARKQIALFTPLGFMPQSHPDGKDAWGLDGAHWQEHRSGWQPEDFDPSWDIYAAEEFHHTDNVGEKLDTPFGALWAIKRISEDEADGRSAGSFRQRVYAAVDQVLNFIWKVRDFFKRGT